MIITKANALAMADAFDRHAEEQTDESRDAAIRVVEVSIVDVEDWQTPTPRAQIEGLRERQPTRDKLGVWSRNWRDYAGKAET